MSTHNVRESLAAESVEPESHSGTPLMSTGETLVGIFFEPGRTFESLRERPRFLLAGVLSIAAVLVFLFIYQQHLGFAHIVGARIEAQSADIDPARKEQIIENQTKPLTRVVNFGSNALSKIAVIAIGAALYLLGVTLMAKQISYRQALAVWVYSSLPQFVLLSLANIILLYLKSPDEIDITGPPALVRVNLGTLVNQTEHPLLALTLGAVGIFPIYGLILACIGLHKVARLSLAAASSIVFGLWILFIVLRVMSEVIGLSL